MPNMPLLQLPEIRFTHQLKQSHSIEDFKYQRHLLAIYTGDASDNSFRGTSGDDRYVSLGQGKDEVYEYNGGGIDVIEFASNIRPETTIMSKVNNDLFFRFIDGQDQLSESNSVEITSFFVSDSYQIETVIFTDGTSWSLDLTQGIMLYVTTDHDISGTNYNDVLFAEATSNAPSADDTLRGLLGDDRYIALGRGHDEAYEYNGGGTDTIEFVPDVHPDTTIMSRVDSNLIFRFQDAQGQLSDSNSVTITNFFVSDSYQIETVIFTDGTSWSLDLTQGITLYITTDHDITGTDYDDVLVAGTTNDPLSVDDILRGRLGNDRYVALGQGHDEISEYNGGGTDIVEFIPDIRPDRTIISKVGYDLFFRFIDDQGQLSDSDSVKITSFFNSNSGYKVETAIFTDGTRWSLTATSLTYLTTNQFTIEAKRVPITTNELRATSALYDDATQTFIISAVTHGQFELTTEPDVAVTSFIQRQLEEGVVEFVHDGSNEPPTFQIAVRSGGRTTQPVDANISFRKVPEFVVHALQISQGIPHVITPDEMQANDANSNDAALRFFMTNVQHGYFELISSPGVPILEFTQQHINNEVIRFIHDGSTEPPTYQIRIDNGQLSSLLLDSSVQFNRSPELETAFLRISQGQSYLLSSANFNAVDDDDDDDRSLIFEVSNISYGQFERVGNATIEPVTLFTQGEILDERIQFTHDNQAIPPDFWVNVTDGAVTTPSIPATIEFNFAPVLQNNLIRLAATGEKLTLTLASLSASDVDGDNANLFFTIDRYRHGRFELLSNPSIPITSFSQQQIIDGDVVFIHDGSAFTPLAEVTLSDSEVHATPVPLQFEIAGLSLLYNDLTLNQGDTITITAKQLSAADTNRDDVSLVFDVDQVTHGQFELVTNPGVNIANFTQQQISDGQVRFVHDGSTNPPNYQVTILNGSTSIPATAPVTSFNRLPVFQKHTLTINQNDAVLLTTQHLSATDVETDDDAIVFYTTSVEHGQFEQVSQPDMPITTFTQQQVKAGLIQFVHDGSEETPRYSISMSDGLGQTTSVEANIAFNRLPKLHTNQLAITGKETLPLSNRTLWATDAETPLGSLVFLPREIQQGYFELKHNSGNELTDFTQQQVMQGEVQFVSTGDIPSYQIAVSDGLVQSEFQTTAITYHQQPSIIFNGFSINQGANITLTDSMIQAELYQANAANAVFWVEGVTHGQFEWATVLGVGVTHFTPQQVEVGNVSFVHDGSPNAPIYQLAIEFMSVSGQRINTSFTPSDIAFNGSPVIAEGLPNHEVEVGQPFEITVDLRGAFSDPEGDSLYYFARTKNSDTLPETLTFNQGTGTLTGLVNQTSVINLEVLAQDPQDLISEPNSFTIRAKEKERSFLELILGLVGGGVPVGTLFGFIVNKCRERKHQEGYPIAFHVFKILKLQSGNVIHDCFTRSAGIISGPIKSHLIATQSSLGKLLTNQAKDAHEKVAEYIAQAIEHYDNENPEKGLLQPSSYIQMGLCFYHKCKGHRILDPNVLGTEKEHIAEGARRLYENASAGDVELQRRKSSSRHVSNFFPEAVVSSGGRAPTALPPFSAPPSPR